MMDKLKMETPDLTDKNISEIGKLFPNVMTETRDENGNVKTTVDFDLLKQILSKDLVEDSDERYRLDWPGKKASLLKANTPITKTLRPCREESVNFDTTENLYIEGDNFEVLKILQESYLGKVKMIYIDPPYNTGNDFIYKDDFTESIEDYEEEIGVENQEGEKLFKNTDSNGRFHSAWLSMMYERLIVARDLLKDDGVIFISIDDNEVHNLRKICDEIFGIENFIGCIVRIAKTTSFRGNFIAPGKDYIICFSKNIERTERFMDEVDQAQYSKVEVSGIRKGEYYRDDIAFYLSTLETRPNQRYYIKCPDGSNVVPPGTTFPPQKPVLGDGVWRWNYESYLSKKELIVFKESKQSPLIDSNGQQAKWNLYTKSYLNDKLVKGNLPRDLWEGYLNRLGSSELKKIEIPFSYPKPSKLVYKLAKIIQTKSDDIVIDFFSGSATTAHAVMQLNAEDGCNRKFIMVQLPEKTDENSEAYKTGYKTITEIGKERIRRAGQKIIKEFEEKNQQLKLGDESIDSSKLDIGFRVYKVDDTNMKDVFYHPSNLGQDQLDLVQNNIKEDRTPEDLLTQVLLDLGLELSLPIEQKKMQENNVFCVQTNALVACFDDNINFKIVDEIAELKPLKVVFKDASFKDDKDRINVEERFKRLSPETKVSVI